MNRTTEGSRKWQILVGGDTKKIQNDKLEMPPQNAKSTEDVMNSILKGEVTYIKVNEGKVENLTKQQVKEILDARKNRKTETALRRMNKQTEMNLR